MREGEGGWEALSRGMRLPGGRAAAGEGGVRVRDCEGEGCVPHPPAAARLQEGPTAGWRVGVKGLGFCVLCLRFWVLGFGFGIRVLGLGFWIQGLGGWIYGSGFGIAAVECMV